MYTADGNSLLNVDKSSLVKSILSLCRKFENIRDDNNVYYVLLIFLFRSYQIRKYEFITWNDWYSINRNDPYVLPILRRTHEVSYYLFVCFHFVPQ